GTVGSNPTLSAIQSFLDREAHNLAERISPSSRIVPIPYFVWAAELFTGRGGEAPPVCLPPPSLIILADG
ncbi:MAG TPA: hypothetical protein VHF07_08160, partial [Nitrospiraceae bacterium]|nr:hypothetical protein [Nitrospiraceae bacterium]